MISDAVRRLAKSLGLKIDEGRTKTLNKDRTAVLRPQDPALSLRRMAEWEAIMDRALDGTHITKKDRAEADEVWLTLKREQPWTFLGWLGRDGKSIEDDSGALVGKAAPGDMHEPEKRLEGWKR